MDIKVYTDAVENHILQVLSFIQKETRYRRDIYCQVTCYPTNSTHQMTVQVSIFGLLPRNYPPCKKWGNALHKELRKFPCLNGLTIKYNHARAQWNDTHYYGDDSYYNTTWANLEHERGLTAYIEANIPQPANASDYVVVRLEWSFNAPDGYTET